MKILIDADGCPVVDICIRISKEYNIEAIIICDTSHIFEREGVKTIVISKGNDNVDFALVNKVAKGDIVVTQDYGLAAMVLSKEGYPINQNGLIYNDKNIGELLHYRYISKKVRASGGKIKGPRKRSEKDNYKFEKELRKLLDSLGGNNSDRDIKV